MVYAERCGPNLFRAGFGPYRDRRACTIQRAPSKSVHSVCLNDLVHNSGCLQEVNVSNNSLTTLEPLSSMDHIKVVNASRNNLSKVLGMHHRYVAVSCCQACLSLPLSVSRA